MSDTPSRLSPSVAPPAELDVRWMEHQGTESEWYFVVMESSSRGNVLRGFGTYIPKRTAYDQPAVKIAASLIDADYEAMAWAKREALRQAVKALADDAESRSPSSPAPSTPRDKALLSIYGKFLRTVRRAYHKTDWRLIVKAMDEYNTACETLPPLDEPKVIQSSRGSGEELGKLLDALIFAANGGIDSQSPSSDQDVNTDLARSAVESYVSRLRDERLTPEEARFACRVVEAACGQSELRYNDNSAITVLYKRLRLLSTSDSEQKHG